METTVFTINDKEFGTVYFVKHGQRTFVILPEIRRVFNYKPVNFYSDKLRNPSASRLAGMVKRFNLRDSIYHNHLLSKRMNRACEYVSRVPCVEVNAFVDYLKTVTVTTKGKDNVRKFFKNNHIIDNTKQTELFDVPLIMDEQDPFKTLHEDISALQNKFKAMQINLDSQKEQIEAKDKSIFALRAKIKELEEQNTDLKSQLEKQMHLNDRFGAFVRSWNSINNATA